MKPLNPWPGVLTRWALLTAAAVGIGLASGRLFLSLILATLAYLTWHLSNVARLERWLRTGRRFEPPHGRGLWEDIFNNIYRLQKRHRQRRRRLADMLHAFRQSVNAMPDAVVVLQAEGEMQWGNSAAEQLLGLRWPRDEGLRLDNLFRHPEFADFLQSEETEAPLTLPSPVDESIMLDLRLVPYGANQRLLLARDITPLHRLEVMRRDFVANISHELRTPLTVIRGLAESLAETESSLAPEDRRGLMLIDEQAQRMGRLVEDLLLLSRLETGAPPRESLPVDVSALLYRLREEAVAVSGERNHDIQLALESDCGLCMEPRELYSAFSNLVTNAINYTPANGRIRIRWRADARGAELSVIDNGIGIPERHLPRLTERFYRVDPGRSVKSGGTGLGLAIVKHILQRYDARLEISSRVGQGSVFTCRFPAALCRAVESPVGSRPPEQGRTASGAG